MLDSAHSVQYWRFRYQAQSYIADYGYRTKCPPVAIWSTVRLWTGRNLLLSFIQYRDLFANYERNLGNIVKKIHRLIICLVFSFLQQPGLMLIGPYLHCNGLLYSSGHKILLTWLYCRFGDYTIICIQWSIYRFRNQSHCLPLDTTYCIYPSWTTFAFYSFILHY